MKLLVLFVQYDFNKYPYSFVYLAKYLSILKNIELKVIIINNKCDGKEYYGNQLTYIDGDNTLWEFSGWQKGLEYAKENNIEYDAVLFANDAFIAPGGFTTPDSIINNTNVETCIKDNLMVGSLCGKKKDKFRINNKLVSTYFRTHLFLMSKNLINKLGNLWSFDLNFINQCTEQDETGLYFKSKCPLNKSLKNYISTILNNVWHSNHRKDLFKMKILAYVNEMMLTQRVRELKQEYKYYISICSIIKNEGRNLREWIDYHKAQGIEHFYIYDNNSEDNTRDIIEEYKGMVTYIPWDKQSPCQLDAYADCTNRFKKDSRWIAFIDADEFIVSKKYLPELMKEYEDFAGLGINWKIYGSSGHDKRPEGKITDNFVYRAVDDFDANRHIKTIANPMLIDYFWTPHSFKYKNNYCVTENKEPIDYPLTGKHSSNIIHINHYYCKSKEDFIEKQKRKRADIKNKGYDLDDFNDHDRNEIYDPLRKDNK